jgi:hypothetical protein
MSLRASFIGDQFVNWLWDELYKYPLDRQNDFKTNHDQKHLNTLQF